MRFDSPHLLDRYILAKTHELVESMASDLDRYDLSSACQRVVQHIDALNNWYIRRSRPRFWKAEQDADKQDAYDTLYTALVTLCRAASPLLPMLTEEIHTGLTGEDSVHLQNWPEEIRQAADPELVSEMDQVREVCSATLALRAAQNARVRQPLAQLVVAGRDLEKIEPYLELIADEVNVKKVVLSEEIEAYASFGLKVDAKRLGPRLGPHMKDVIKASKEGRWTASADDKIQIGEFELEESEYTLTLQPREGVACQALPGNDAIVVLDLDLTPELISEGMARDIVRIVQQARKDSGLDVADRIRLHLPLEGEWRQALEDFREYVSEQTLTTELNLDPIEEPQGDPRSENILHTARFGGVDVQFSLSRVSD